MKKSLKEWRMEQIAIVILYRYFGNIKVRKSNSPLCDLIVEYQDGSNLRFGVNVKSSEYKRTESYKSMVDRLSKIDLQDERNRFPVVLMFVNENKETATISMQVGWRFGRPQIFSDFEQRQLNNENANLCLDIIKAMDEVIRMVSTDNIYFLKNISFEKISLDNRVQRASILYLRKASINYKMKVKEVVTEKERFNRLLSGTPEDEYPNDELDKEIFDSVNDSFKNVKTITKVILFSTEIRDLQRYKQIYTYHTNLLIYPDLVSIPENLYGLIRGMESINIPVDLYVENSLYKDEFCNLSFTKTMPLNGWMKTYNELNELIKSYALISKFFV